MSTAIQFEGPNSACILIVNYGFVFLYIEGFQDTELIEIRFLGDDPRIVNEHRSLTIRYNTIFFCILQI